MRRQQVYCYSTVSRHVLITHNASEHNIENIYDLYYNMYKCIKCGKIYKYKSEYDRHINRKNPCESAVVFTTSTVFKCSDCLNTYATKGSLKRHRNGYCTGKQTDNDDNQSDREEIDNPSVEEDHDDEFKCEHCNKTFTFKHNLKRHIVSRCIAKENIVNQKSDEDITHTKNMNNQFTNDMSVLRSDLNTDTELMLKIELKSYNDIDVINDIKSIKMQLNTRIKQMIDLQSKLDEYISECV